MLAISHAARAAPGCYRTHYVRFAPTTLENPGSPSANYYLPKKTRGWQNFFVFGWVPGEVQVDAVDLCGGPELVRSIHTQLSFVEGLVAGVARYGLINIYSPWDGSVHCIDPPVAVAPKAPTAASP